MITIVHNNQTNIYNVVVRYGYFVTFIVSSKLSNPNNVIKNNIPRKNNVINTIVIILGTTKNKLKKTKHPNPNRNAPQLFLKYSFSSLAILEK